MSYHLQIRALDSKETAKFLAELERVPPGYLRNARVKPKSRIDPSLLRFMGGG